MPSNFNSPVPRIRHHLLQLGLQSLLTRYGVRLARAPFEVVVHVYSNVLCEHVSKVWPETKSEIQEQGLHQLTEMPEQMLVDAQASDHSPDFRPYDLVPTQ